MQNFDLKEARLFVFPDNDNVNVNLCFTVFEFLFLKLKGVSCYDSWLHSEVKTTPATLGGEGNPFVLLIFGI